MVNKQELRLGNYLTYCNLTVHVLGMTKHSVELGYYKDSVGFYRTYDDIDIQPIPLTADVLVKCGFERKQTFVNGHDYYTWNQLDLVMQKEGFLLTDHSKMFNAPGLVVVDTLHQLQNLTHALTGKELEVKL